MWEENMKRKASVTRWVLHSKFVRGCWGVTKWDWTKWTNEINSLVSETNFPSERMNGKSDYRICPTFTPQFVQKYLNIEYDSVTRFSARCFRHSSIVDVSRARTESKIFSRQFASNIQLLRVSVGWFIIIIIAHRIIANIFAMFAICLPFVRLCI